MEVLNTLLENSDIPILSAFVLGLMTAISPCPLATNITAIGFIGKNIESRQRVFVNGLVYTLGRAVSYTLLGLVFFSGIGQFEISDFLQSWGEKILGPLLIIIGLFMLGIFKLTLPGLGRLHEKMEQQAQRGYLGAFLIGIVFALAFCPYSGVLYFGMLIPMTVTSASGLYLPAIFAIATGIPVILFAWLIAFSISSLGSFYDKMKLFETWFRKVIAILFIITGIYFLYLLF